MSGLAQGQSTGFKDKHNNDIHVGDILQIGLGISDRTRKQVIVKNKKVLLVNADDYTGYYGGTRLAASDCKHAVIIQHIHS